MGLAIRTPPGCVQHPVFSTIGRLATRPWAKFLGRKAGPPTIWM